MAGLEVVGFRVYLDLNELSFVGSRGSGLRFFRVYGFRV